MRRPPAVPHRTLALAPRRHLPGELSLASETLGRQADVDAGPRGAPRFSPGAGALSAGFRATRTLPGSVSPRGGAPPGQASRGLEAGGRIDGDGGGSGGGGGAGGGAAHRAFAGG